MQSILLLYTGGEIYASSMAFGAVCPSLQTTWLIYVLKIIKTIAYYVSDNKSEDSKSIDYRYID